MNELRRMRGLSFDYHDECNNETKNVGKNWQTRKSSLGNMVPQGRVGLLDKSTFLENIAKKTQDGQSVAPRRTFRPIPMDDFHVGD